MSTLIIPSVNQPLQSILISPTTNSMPSTTEDTHHPAPSTPGPAHQTQRPRLVVAIPNVPRHTTFQGSRRPRQRRGGSPPPPPHNTPTIHFGTEPQGPSAHRQQRALQRLSTNGALRPPRPRRRQRVNRAAELELENTAARPANREEEDARRATAEFEHAVLSDPYVWSRWSYPANWEEHNDRVQHSEEPL